MKLHAVLKTLLTVSCMSLMGMAAAADPVASLNAVAAKCWTNAFRVTSTSSTYTLDRINRINDTIRGVILNKAGLNNESIKLIEDELLKTVTQEELNDALSFSKNCIYDYIAGIPCPKSIGMNRFYAMYDIALRDSGRTAAYKLFKETDGELTFGYNKGSLSYDDYVKTNFKTAEQALEYMNSELYWNINPFASVIANELIKIKRHQLIDDGYAVVYRSVNYKAEYSDGAELLLEYANKLVDAFNSAYFFGLNSRLAEAKLSCRFNNPRVLNKAEARTLANLNLYGETNMNFWRSDVRWMLRLTLGVADYNELLDRINNGSETRKSKAKTTIIINAQDM